MLRLCGGLWKEKIHLNKSVSCWRSLWVYLDGYVKAMWRSLETTSTKAFPVEVLFCGHLEVSGMEKNQPQQALFLLQFFLAVLSTPSLLLHTSRQKSKTRPHWLIHHLPTFCPPLPHVFNVANPYAQIDVFSGWTPKAPFFFEGPNIYS